MLSLVAPAGAQAFSVLAHQGIVDEAWEHDLAPILQKRFPDLTQDDLDRARAFAYGGSHLADLGYFPFGNEFFSELLHYVRAGDFVSTLVDEAHTPTELAFALGAVAHYVADSVGHPHGTNRAVAMLYPKLAREHGQDVSYEDSPSAHLQTEFRFDVLQVARRGEIPGLFEHAVGFAVEKPLLERAFRETYGLEIGDLFTSFDTALVTYRWAFRGVVDEATGIAWQLYRADIDSFEPNATQKDWLRAPTPDDFRKQFGEAFLEPGYFARFVAWLGNLVPNVGPFKRLPYKPLPPEVQNVYREAFHEACDRYRAELRRVARGGRVRLPDVDLDTGKSSAPGEYALADQAYVDLVERLSERDFRGAPSALIADLRTRFRDRDAALGAIDSKHPREKAEQALRALDAMPIASR